MYSSGVEVSEFKLSLVIVKIKVSKQRDTVGNPWKF
jgi:hypothetical protein